MESKIKDLIASTPMDVIKRNILEIYTIDKNDLYVNLSKDELYILKSKYEFLFLLKTYGGRKYSDIQFDLIEEYGVDPDLLLAG